MKSRPPVLVLAIMFLVSTQMLAQSSAFERARGGPLDKSNPESLLIRSYLLGKQFPDEERAYLLVRLADAASKVQPAFTKLWTEELFELTFNLPVDWDRVAVQKNALVALSRVDPVHALDLFASMDRPVPSADGSISEDVRAFGAQTIFGEVYKEKGREATDALRLQAQRLGQTGQYPYLAMAPILLELSKVDAPAAESLFVEALSYYPKDFQIRSNNQEFIQFLLMVWKAIPPALVRSALQTSVEKLTGREELRENEAYQARVYTKAGTVAFQNPADELILQLLPVIRALDPDLVSKLKEARPRLGQSTNSGDSPQGSERVVVKGQAPPEVVTALQQRGIEQARLRYIESIVANDFQEALRLSMTLTDPGLRSVALALTAAHSGTTDPARTTKLIDQSQQAVTSIHNKADKVRALVALAEALAARSDTPAVRKSLKEAFDLGTEILQEDLDAHPAKHLILAKAFDDLALATSLGVRVDKEYTLAYLSSLQNQLLQAQLLVDASRSMYDSEKVAQTRPK